MSDARYRNFKDPVCERYYWDLFDPSTWTRGVIGVGGRPLGVSDHDERDAFERDVIRRRANYQGRGPKNYSRSDEQIYEDVCEALTHDNDVDATQMEVKVTDGVVELIGLAHTRHQKYIAEDIASGVFGVKDVRNQLAVDKIPRFGAPVIG